MANASRDPVGRGATEAVEERAARSEDYRGGRAEYERICALREVSPIAAFALRRIADSWNGLWASSAKARLASVVRALGVGHDPSVTAIYYVRTGDV